MNNADKAVLTGTKIKPLQPLFADGQKTDQPPAVQPHPNLSLAARAVWLQVLALCASAVILSFLILSVLQFLNAQSLYEAAQQQRIYNQRYAKEVLLAAGGVPVSYEKTSSEWLRAMNLLTQGGELIVADGQPSQKVAPPLDNSRFKADLDRLAEVRHQIVDGSEDYLNAAKLTKHRVELFDELYRQSLEFQAAGDALVGTYDKHLDSGVSWWDVNAVAVELAERQRMLIQQHIKEVLFVAHGVPADYQTTRLRLYESLKILTDGGTLSIDNKDAITIPAPGSEDIRFNLKHQKEALDRFTAVSNQFLMLANEDVERSIKLKQISDLTAEFHDSSTTLLMKYRGFFEGRVKRAARDAGAAGILAAIFILVLTWGFVNKYIETPLKNIADTIRRIRKSDAPVALLDPARGAAGEAVSELNAYLEKRRTRQQWFDQFLTSSDPAEISDPGSEDPVASRVYQWHRARGSQSPASNRWNSFEDNGIEVVGRLPDADPVINDSDLLDDLLHRANELQSQHEQLTALNRRLTDEAAALNQADSELRASQSQLRSENESLRSQIARTAADYESLKNQALELQKTEGRLVRTEADADALLEHIKAQLRTQEEEIKGLRADLETKRRELVSSHTDLQVLRNEISSHSLNHEALASVIDENQRVIGIKDELIARLTQRLSEAEDQTGLLAADLDRSSLRAEAEALRREEAVQQIAELTRRIETLIQTHEQHLRQKDTIFAEAHREHDAAMEIANSARIQLQAIQDEQSNKIRYQQDSIAQLQRTLGDQAALLDAVRSDLSLANQSHAAQLQSAEQLLQQTQDELAGSRLQNGELEQLNQFARQAYEKIEKELAELDQRMQDKETEVWQLRRTLVERDNELTAAKSALDQKNDSLRAIAADRVSSDALMNAEIARLKNLLAAMEKDFLQEKEELQSGLKATRDAYREKCQALTSAEERLSATRAALKSSLDELQEKLGPSA